jgi:hypothetical protein
MPLSPLPQVRELIRQVTHDFPRLSLTELSRTLCELLQWRRANEALKTWGCYSFVITIWVIASPRGAQLRYFVRSSRSSRPLLACLLFTSPAWKMAPRDTWIGWSDAARQDQPSPPRQSQPLPHPALGSRPPSRQPYLSSRRSTASARLVHPLSPRPLSWPPSMTPFAQRRDAISPASARRVTLAPSPFTSISAAACASSSFPCLPPSGVPTHSGRPSP